MVCDVYGDDVAPLPIGVYGVGASINCPGNGQSYPPGGMGIWTVANRAVEQGSAVHWNVTAPWGMTIDSVYIPHMWSYGIDDGAGWGGGFYWAGGSGGVQTFDQETGWSSRYAGSPHFIWPTGGTPYFGWQVICAASPCRNGGDEWLSVELLELNMRETVGPYLTAPDGLWESSGWIRGDWTLHYYGDSPSGLCSLQATLSDRPIPGSSSGADPALWHQCAAPAVSQTVNTAQYGQGALPLTISATDAAGASVSYTRTVHVDNQPPTLSFSGPADAPSTAGTQYITASAAAGPSGVDGIACSLDGAPYQFRAGTSTRIAVQGTGVHRASCYAENNAIDARGASGMSPIETWTLSIRQPSLSTVAFARVVNALRCAKKRERLRIPAHWVTVHDHGRSLRIELPAQTRTITVVHCHPRIVRRRVRVHGRWETERVVLLPHTVRELTKRVPYGAATTISGWLGTAEGNALAGQRVRILTAPDNGHRRFTQAAVAITASDGSWTAGLPAGPSRLVEAVYDGAPTVEPSQSQPAHIVVPSSLSMVIRPQSTHWGGRITISGRLRGGYIPPAGELVMLRIGWPGGSTEIGHLYTRRNGRFGSTYTFLRGNGTETYELWAETATESDYPYATSRSEKVAVTVKSVDRPAPGRSTG